MLRVDEMKGRVARALGSAELLGELYEELKEDFEELKRWMADVRGRLYRQLEMDGNADQLCIGEGERGEGNQPDWWLECTKCGMRFVQGKVLYQHWRTVHGATNGTAYARTGAAMSKAKMEASEVRKAQSA